MNGYIYVSICELTLIHEVFKSTYATNQHTNVLFVPVQLVPARSIVMATWVVLATPGEIKRHIEGDSSLLYDRRASFLPSLFTSPPSVH